MAKKKAAPKKTVKKAKKARKAAPKKKAAKRSAPKKTSAKAKAKAKRTRKASAAPAAPALPWRKPLEGEGRIGVVQDYYGHISVIALVLEKPLKVGDTIHVHGHTTDLKQVVDSIQIGHQTVSQAAKGEGVGIKVSDKCRNGDYVFLIRS